jgi:hypothetical protein
MDRVRRGPVWGADAVAGRIVIKRWPVMSLRNVLGRADSLAVSAGESEVGA